MKNKKLNFYFGTKGCPSKYDSMNWCELLTLIFHADYFEEDKVEFLQAFQNKFSKRLGVPTIKLAFKPIFHTGVFRARDTKKRIQNVKIIMDPYSDLAEMIFTVPHEVKHSEQVYDLHKFLNYNVLPKDDLSKAILISNILEQVSVKYVRNLEYHSELEELDARIFAINQMQSLMNKYSLYGNIDFNLHLREQLFVLLYDLRYNYEGIENPEIKKSMQNLKTGIKDAISGECGESCKSCIEKILNSGFDIERAYTAITKNLDKYCSWLVLENYKFNKLGATSIYLAKNGELNYEPRQNYSYSESVIADGSIDPYSEYGEYIKKYACTDNGEYDKLFKGFVEQARNCNSF